MKPLGWMCNIDRMRISARRFLQFLSLTSVLLASHGCMAMKHGRIGKMFSPGESETILESDVAAPPDMESRHTSNIEHQGETLCGGRFTFRGPLEESDSFAHEITDRYTQRGWMVTCSHVTPNQGQLFFHKDTRQVEVNFKASPLNPAMSQATVFVGLITKETTSAHMQPTQATAQTATPMIGQIPTPKSAPTSTPTLVQPAVQPSPDSAKPTQGALRGPPA